ncbi:hypothetical protein ACI3QN_13640, partial [Propionibacterium freudenreichii]|uniref:hypothetical protein n=1 Tax=Propionibacterium freudenreichii TaxID=1744 RepID=UPI0038544E8B
SPSESNAFFSFCRYYTSGVRNFAERIFTYKDLLGAYIAFSTDSERETFIQFCEGFFLGSSVFDRAHLLPVYKRSPEEQ